MELVNEKMTNLANAIRGKTGETASLTIDEMAVAVEGIESGGTDTSDATATSDDILSGKTAYVDGEKITGTINTVEPPNPTITVNQSTGLITTTVPYQKGYMANDDIKQITKQLAFQAAQTITPGTTNQTIAGNTYLGGVQTIKGDSNLVAGNIKAGATIFNVTGTYEGTGSGSGGDTSIEDSIITKTVTTYTNSKVTSIGPYAFGYCSNLTSVSFPNCTIIGSYAFGYCSNLTSVSFPNCTIIDTYAFRYCTNLLSVSFPNCTSIGPYTFYYCSNLTSISFPNCTTIGSYAFSNCTKLTSVSFPNCTTIGSWGFYYCSNLTSVSFPKCTVIGGGAFVRCSNLTSVSFPKCTTIGSNAFSNCTKLTSVSFPNCTTIGSWGFNYCSKLTSIYLLASSVCQLSNSNAFFSAGITSTRGYIYVPSSLVASYKTATNWTYFSNRIFGM